jgi:hypothetical protein
MRRMSLRIAPLTDQRAWRSEYGTAAGTIKLTSVPDLLFDVMDSFAFRFAGRSRMLISPQ